MESFEKVGRNQFRENCAALLTAQELTNRKAGMFRVTYDGYILEGLISSVHVQDKYFILQLPDGTLTEMDELESMINSEVQKLPHIKYNNGFLVKMFQ